MQHELWAADAVTLKLILPTELNLTSEMMMEFEDADFFLEPWTQHEKRKRKKDSKKAKKGQKQKAGTAEKTPESIQKKKKKSSKFKEAMGVRKEKKKEKKKKKRSASEIDDSLIFTQGKSTKTLEASDLRQIEKPKPDHVTQDALKKTKRKNKVMFDLPPKYIGVKRPKFVSSLPKEKEALRGGESCPQVTATENESQCSCDEYNSQDLFITQKTFRASPPQPSSGEEGDEVFMASPQGFSQQGKRWCSSQLHEDLHENIRKSNEHEPQDKKILKKEKHMEFKARLSQENKLSPSSVMNPYLDEAVVVNHSPDVAQINTSYHPHIHESPLVPSSAVSTSTQTENFFTAELSSYLSFCLKSKETLRFEDLKPLDLSLPQRATKDIGRRLSVITAGEGEQKFSDWKTQEPPGEIKGTELKKKVSFGAEGTPSPQSESEVKASDTTTSSEDDLTWRSGKLDLTQVRAVQMRLNESFFFKTKGEGHSPRPESPLMKLTQGRSIKTKKRS